jgi:alanine racemase
VAVISLENLRHNYNRLRERLSPGVKFMAIVKADAYGHGAVPVSRALEGFGCDAFGVATVKEGAELRQSGIKRPIVVLGGVYSGDEDAIFSHDLTPVLSDMDLARTLNAAAVLRKTKKKVHVKIDTGMGRLGLLPGDVKGFLSEFKGCAALELEGVMSHYAEADMEDASFTRSQRETFVAAIDAIKALGFNPAVRHMSNSAAIVSFPDSHFDMARAGLMLYGAYPMGRRFEKLIDLRPVMTLKSRVAQIKSVGAGFSVSYGRRFVTERPSRIAAVPMGYADGLPMVLSGNAEMLVRGMRAPVLGSICMDTTIIDVTDAEGANAGDEVVIIGSQGAETITAQDVAERAGTISYEILCKVGPRVERVFKS